MLVDAYIARLTAEVAAPGIVRTVSGAGDLAQAQRDYRNPPALWVVPVSEQAQPTRAMPLKQRVTHRVAVVACVRNAGDTTGGGSSLAELETVRTAVLTALLGWKPDSQGTGAELVGGQLVDLRGRALWWQDTFQSDTWIKEA